MKSIAAILIWLIQMAGFLSYHYSRLIIGPLSALLEIVKFELRLQGDSETVNQIEAMGEDVEKDRLVYEAKRATAVNPSEEVK